MGAVAEYVNVCAVTLPPIPVNDPGPVKFTTALVSPVNVVALLPVYLTASITPVKVGALMSNVPESGNPAVDVTFIVVAIFDNVDVIVVKGYKVFTS
jgi:hypothetical protein